MLRALKAPSAEGSSPTGAAPVLLAAKLTNASRIEPLEYGDALIGLSGIYALVNAIRLVMANKRQLNGGEVYVLMSAAFEFLSARHTAKQIFASGCRVSLWREMGQAMVETARLRLGIHLGLDRVFVPPRGDKCRTVRGIEEAIANWQPVLMQLRGGRYTVVSGFTPSSLLLFDGGGAHWLSKHACTVPGDGNNARHLLNPGSLMALRA